MTVVLTVSMLFCKRCEHSCFLMVTFQRLKTDMFHQFGAQISTPRSHATSEREWQLRGWVYTVYVCVGGLWTPLVCGLRQMWKLSPTCLHSIYLVVIHWPPQSDRTVFKNRTMPTKHNPQGTVWGKEWHSGREEKNKTISTGDGALLSPGRTSGGMLSKRFILLWRKTVQKYIVKPKTKSCTSKTVCVSWENSHFLLYCTYYDEWFNKTRENCNV